MKIRITFLCSFFAFILFPEVQAQDTLPCDTLVLKNGRNLSVHIDSLNEINTYYHGCNDTRKIGRTMPRNLISEIKTKNEKWNIMIAEMEAEAERKAIAEAEMKAEINSKLSGIDKMNAKVIAEHGPIKRWIFKNAAKKIEKKLTSGNSIKVNYRFSDGRNKEVEGALLDIKPEAIILHTSRKGKWEIPKKDIRYIELQKNKGNRSILGALLLLVALGAFAYACWFFLVYIFSLGAMGGAQLGRGLIISAIAFIASTFTFFASNNISDPFSDDWEISEEIISESESKSTENTLDYRP